MLNKLGQPIDYDKLRDFMFTMGDSAMIPQIKAIRSNFQVGLETAKMLYEGWELAKKLQVSGTVQLSAFLEGWHFGHSLRYKDKATKRGFYAAMM